MTRNSARPTSWPLWRWRRWRGATNSVMSPGQRRGLTDEAPHEAGRVSCRLPVLSVLYGRCAPCPALLFPTGADAVRGRGRQTLGAGLFDDSRPEDQRPQALRRSSLIKPAPARQQSPKLSGRRHYRLGISGAVRREDRSGPLAVVRVALEARRNDLCRPGGRAQRRQVRLPSKPSAARRRRRSGLSRGHDRRRLDCPAVQRALLRLGRPLTGVRATADDQISERERKAGGQRIARHGLLVRRYELRAPLLELIEYRIRGGLIDDQRTN